MHEYDFGFSLPKGYQVFLDDLGISQVMTLVRRVFVSMLKKILPNAIKPTRLMRMNQISL